MESVLTALALVESVLKVWAAADSGESSGCVKVRAWTESVLSALAMMESIRRRGLGRIRFGFGVRFHQ